MKQIRAEAFAAKYIQHNCCGARALRALGAKGSVQSLSTQAAQLLKKLEVQAALSAIRKEIAMDAPDVVGRMSDMARASLEDFLNRDGRVDLAKARRLGKLHLARARQPAALTPIVGPERHPCPAVPGERVTEDDLAAVRGTACRRFHGDVADEDRNVLQAAAQAGFAQAGGDQLALSNLRFH